MREPVDDYAAVDAGEADAVRKFSTISHCIKGGCPLASLPKETCP